MSTKYPIGEVDPMMLADGMYYKKQNNLGKKRKRPEDEQNKTKNGGFYRTAVSCRCEI